MPERFVLRRGQMIVAGDLRTARRIRERTRGLIGGPRLSPGEGLLLEPARQVHTFGMRYPVDILFCDADWKVVHVALSVKPKRVTRFVLSARRAIELPEGNAAEIRKGDVLSLDQVPSER